MNNTISVIIPIYNHAAALEKSLRTLFAQTHRPLEIIAVNDGSTDNVEEVLKKMSEDLNSVILNRLVKRRASSFFIIYLFPIFKMTSITRS